MRQISVNIFEKHMLCSYKINNVSFAANSALCHFFVFFNLHYSNNIFNPLSDRNHAFEQFWLGYLHFLHKYDTLSHRKFTRAPNGTIFRFSKWRNLEIWRHNDVKIAIFGPFSSGIANLSSFHPIKSLLLKMWYLIQYRIFI